MTTYREIHGRSIKSVSTDPTAEVTEGEIWYNTTSETFKSVIIGEAWSSGSPLIAAKGNGGSLPGSPSSYGLAAGGSTGGSWTSAVNSTYSWNGSGWASESNMSVARNGVRGDGSSTSALFVGGIKPPAADYSNASESWNGSSWTTETNYPQDINETSVAGTETAAVVAGGYDYIAAPSTGGRTRETFEYDGSSWTSQNNKPFGASNMGSAGTQTASIFFGGFGQPGDGTAPSSPSSNPLSSAEEYDGTNWTTVSSLNVAKYGITGSGNQTDAGGVGGHPYLNTFEKYDGTSWTQSATLATGRTTSFSGGVPNSTAGSFVSGGNKSPGGSMTDTTEEFLRSANVITGAAWSSGGATNTSRRAQAGLGTQTANIIAGGYTGSYISATESYDGSSWTTLPASLPGNQSGGAGCGTQPSGITFGGEVAPKAQTNEWNGSAWTSGGAMNTGRQYLAGFGTQTSAVAAGGSFPAVASVEEYNGTSWTEVADLNTARRSITGAGIATAGLVFGGVEDLDATEEWNGSSWTASGNLNRGITSSSGTGTQTAALAMGGSDPGESPTAVGYTENYDGTSWVTSATMAQGRSVGSGTPAGTSTAALQTNGSIQTAPTSHPGSTEEFTGETTALNVKTLTQS
jgi:hypothetical protein